MNAAARPSFPRRRLLRALAAPALACATARLAAPGIARAADPLPIFDAHLHYSHDAWEMLPPPKALELLRAAGVRRALVSSSGDDGQQTLARLAPQLILPSLRPYRVRGDQTGWHRDETIKAYLDTRLAAHRYVALGEFHIFGADVDGAVARHLVAAARARNLVLHSHSDADAIERQFVQWPAARILWAHAGFDPPERVRAMLERHPKLWCDLAFRTDHAPGGRLEPEWKALFLAHPTRFLVGSDTFTPERWPYVVEHARWVREWLAALPAPVAERIAWRNGEALFGPGA